MQSRKEWRLLACFASPLVALGLVLASCRDTITSSEERKVTDDARVTRPTGISDVAVRARAHLHERNRHDWVGESHNRAFDDLRKEMRKPGVLTNNVCDYVLDFVTSPARLPVDKRAKKSGHREEAMAGLATTPICKPKASLRGASLATPSWSSASAGQIVDASPLAYELLGGVESAIDGAADSYDLAGRLNLILDRASGLESAEREMIGSTISVAQYSYEYWEPQYPPLEQEFYSEYGDCAMRYINYSSEESRRICLEGGTELMSAPTKASPGSMMSFATFHQDECRLSKHFKRLAKADATGAFVGAFRRILTINPVGIGVGAFEGGLTASFGIFVASTWDLWQCAMRR